jgi:hypothetical protein
MDVVGHQAESMDAATEFLDDSLQKEIKPVPVAILEEDVLLGVAAQDYVVECAGEVYALFASHEEVVRDLKQQSKPDPVGVPLKR